MDWSMVGALVGIAALLVTVVDKWPILKQQFSKADKITDTTLTIDVKLTLLGVGLMVIGFIVLSREDPDYIGMIGPLFVSLACICLGLSGFWPDEAEGRLASCASRIWAMVLFVGGLIGLLAIWVVYF